MNIRKAALGAALAVSTATMAHAGVIIAPVAATIPQMPDGLKR